MTLQQSYIFHIFSPKTSHIPLQNNPEKKKDLASTAASAQKCSRSYAVRKSNFNLEMSLFILKPEKLSLLVEMTKLYRLLSLNTAGSYGARIEYSGIAQVPFRAASAVPHQQAEENPSEAKSKQRKTQWRSGKQLNLCDNYTAEYDCYNY